MKRPRFGGSVYDVGMEWAGTASAPGGPAHSGDGWLNCLWRTA